MQRQIKSTQSLSPFTGLAYSIPVVPVVLLLGSTNVLSGLYAKHYGLSLGVISMAVLLAGVFDAFTDPSIGYLSDRYHARTGSRRPFVVGGALLLIPSAWFLLSPPDGVTVVYFLFWYLAFYLASTMFTIPHLTWGGELCPNSVHRNRIFGYRNYGSYLGLTIFMVLPMTPLTDGSEVTPEVMRYLVIVAAVILLPSLYLFIRHVPTGVHRHDVARKTENPFRAMKALSHNKPLMLCISGAAFYFIALASDGGLKFMVMDAWLGIGDYYVHLFLLQLIVATLTIGPGVRLMERIGKKKSYLVALGLAIVSFLILPFALVRGDYSLLLYGLFNVTFGLSSAIGNVAFFSILSDLSDYGTLKSGVDRSATCFSLQSLASKTCLAMGIGFYIALAGWFGFDPATERQPDGVYWGLVVAMAIIPTLCTVAAMICFSLIGVDERRHDIIRRRLDQREDRLKRQTDQSIGSPSGTVVKTAAVGEG
ncbi:MFS transporter [Paremcibacter congregatus]|uniref:MFS transporter n=1 Tax=Paremcibacter congregatus TaxID=2043170 RepID=UPI003A9137EA